MDLEAQFPAAAAPTIAAASPPPRSSRPTTAPAAGRHRRLVHGDGRLASPPEKVSSMWSVPAPPPRDEPIPERMRQQMVPFKDEVRAKKQSEDNVTDQTYFIIQTNVDKPMLTSVVLPPGMELRLRQTALDLVHSTDFTESAAPATPASAARQRNRSPLSPTSRAPSRLASPHSAGAAKVTPAASPLSSVKSPTSTASAHFTTKPSFLRPQSAKSNPQVQLDVKKIPVSSNVAANIRANLNASSLRTPRQSIPTKKAHTKKVVMSFELEAPLEEILHGRADMTDTKPSGGLYAKLDKRLSRRMKIAEQHLERIATYDPTLRNSDSATSMDNQQQSARIIVTTAEDDNESAEDRSPTRRSPPKSAHSVRRIPSPKFIFPGMSPKVNSKPVVVVHEAFLLPSSQSQPSSPTGRMDAHTGSIKRADSQRRTSVAADPNEVLRKLLERERARGPSVRDVVHHRRVSTHNGAELTCDDDDDVRHDSARESGSPSDGELALPVAAYQMRRTSVQVQAGPSVDERDADARADEQDLSMRRTPKPQRKGSYSPSRTVFRSGAIIEDAHQREDMMALRAGPNSAHFGNPQPPVHPVGIFRSPLYSPVTRHIKVPMKAVVEAGLLQAGIDPMQVIAAGPLTDGEYSERPLVASVHSSRPVWGQPHDFLKQTVGDPRIIVENVKFQTGSKPRPSTAPKVVAFSASLPKTEVLELSQALGMGAAHPPNGLPTPKPRFQYHSLLGHTANRSPLPRRPATAATGRPGAEYAYNVSTVADYKLAAIYTNTESEILAEKHRQVGKQRRASGFADATVNKTAHSSAMRPSSATRPRSALVTNRTGTPLLGSLPTDGADLLRMYIANDPASADMHLDELAVLAGETQEELVYREERMFEAAVKEMPAPWLKQSDGPRNLQELSDMGMFDGVPQTDISPWQ